MNRPYKDLSDQELDSKIDAADEAHDKVWNEPFNPDESFEEYQERLRPTGKLCSDLNFEQSMRTPIEWEDIPDYGDLFTIEDWKENVACEGFIDYDGYGNYATKDKVSNKTVSPSHVKNDKLRNDPEFTHIVWYNR